MENDSKNTTTNKNINLEDISLKDDINITELIAFLKRRKKFIIVLFIFIFSFNCIRLASKRITSPLYRGSFQILISDPISSTSKGGNTTDDVAIESIVRNESKNDLSTLVAFLKSPLALKDVALKYKMAPESLISRVTITRDPRREIRGIIGVSLTSDNPKRDKKLLHDLSKNYLQLALKERQKRLSDGIDFIDQQAPSLEEKKNILEEKLLDFRKKNNFILPEIEVDNLIQINQKLEKDLNIARQTIYNLKSIKEKVINNKLNAKGFVEVMEESKGYLVSFNQKDQAVLDELFLKEENLKNLQTIYKNNSLPLRKLKQSIESLTPKARKIQIQLVDIAIELNEAEYERLKDAKRELKLKNETQPELVKEYTSLQEKLNFSKKNINGLLTTRERFQLEVAQNNVPWQIINPPKFASKPFSPNISRGLSVGTLVSIFLATFFGYVRDRVDYVYRTRKDAEDELKLASLGHIPYVDFFKNIREDKKLILELDEKSKEDNNKENKYQRFFYQEALRNIYTSIRYANADGDLKIILLTSSTPQEGKTMINILLSKTIAEMGKKVLLIDCDLRKPQVHSRLGIDNFEGISNLITDKEYKLEKYIKKIDNYDNWDVITSGVKPPDPTRLLSSTSSKQIFNELKKNQYYDFIIIDGPPLLGLSDSLLLSENVDGMILLVSLGLVNRNIAKESKKRLENSQSKVLGLITNSVSAVIQARSNGYGYVDEYSTAYAYLPDDNDGNENSNEIKEVENPFSEKIKLLIETSKKNIDKFLDWIDQ